MEERLRKFAHLVDSGSFTKASAELHLSQPALSTAISKLERELRTPLLIRGSRSFQLTDAGQAAYVTAKELAISTTNLVAKLDILAHKQPDLAIGMIDSLANAFFGVKSFVEKLESQARLSVVVNNSRYLARAVEHDELDIAFVTEMSKYFSTFTQSTHIGSEPMIAVCHSTDRSKANAAIQAGKLPNFISYDQPSNSHKLIHAALLREGIVPETTFYSTSPEIMLQLVLLRKGGAVLPYSLVSTLLQQGQLAWIGAQKPLVIDRNIGTIIRREKDISPSLKTVIQHIQQLLASQQRAVFELAMHTNR